MDWNEELISASSNGDLNLAHTCINNGADADYASGRWTCRTPLIIAIQDKKENIVEFLLDKGANVNIQRYNSKKYIPLSEEISKNSLNIVKLLVNAGASINGEDYSFTIQAVRENRLSILEYLILNGADINQTSCWNKCALEIAIERNHIDIVQYLAHVKCIDLNKLNEHGRTPLELAARQKSQKMIEALVEAGASIGNECLITVITQKNKELIKYLVSKGANINSRNGGETPLSAAVKTGDLEIVQWLLENGAHFSIPTTFMTALHTRDLEIIKLFINKGTSVNFQYQMCVRKVLPLIEAIEMKEVEVVRHLLNHGADPNLCDSRGKLPLTQAIELRQLQIVQELIEKGAKVNLPDGSGKNPLDIAFEVRDEAITKILLENKASVTSNSFLSNCIQKKIFEGIEFFLKNKKDLVDVPLECGYTPLTKSAQMDDYKMVEFLVTNGASVNKTDEEENTALGLAVSNRNFQIIDFLLRSGSDFELAKKEIEMMAETNDDFAVYLENMNMKKSEEKEMSTQKLDSSLLTSNQEQEETS